MDRNLDMYMSLYVNNFDMLYGNAENMDDTEKDRLMQFVESTRHEERYED